jgi:hypothetical protein
MWILVYEHRASHGAECGAFSDGNPTQQWLRLAP